MSGGPSEGDGARIDVFLYSTVEYVLRMEEVSRYLLGLFDRGKLSEDRYSI